MKRIYTTLIFFAVVLIFSLDASAQGAPNGTPNGTPNGIPNGTPNGTSNGTPNGAPNGLAQAVEKAGSRSIVSVSVDPTIDTPPRVRKQRITSGEKSARVVPGSAADADRFDRDKLKYIYAPAADESQNIQVQNELNGRPSYNSPVGTKENTYSTCTIFRTVDRCK